MLRKRFLQKFLAAVFGLVSVSMLVAAFTSPRPIAVIPLIAMMLVPLLIGAVPIGILEMQLRAIEQAGEVIRANISEIARSVFDAPGEVRPGYDLSVTSPATAAFVAAFDTDKGFTTDGTFRGARVSVGSHVSVAGRQVGEMQHTYSHVVVDMLGLEKPFAIRKEGVGARLGRAIGIVKDATVGDETFDEMFVVEADDELARAVLDESIRERLVTLQKRVPLVSSEIGPGGMRLVLTRHGLALRWPGDITPDLASYVRDLLLDMREKMLAYESRKAVRVEGAATGYRIAEDPANEQALAEAREEEAQQEEAAAEESSVGERRA